MALGPAKNSRCIPPTRVEQQVTELHEIMRRPSVKYTLSDTADVTPVTESDGATIDVTRLTATLLQPELPVYKIQNFTKLHMPSLSSLHTCPGQTQTIYSPSTVLRVPVPGRRRHHRLRGGARRTLDPRDPIPGPEDGSLRQMNTLTTGCLGCQDDANCT